MTGGMAYLYDPEAILIDHINMESLVVGPLASAYWEAELKDLIKEHLHETRSARAQEILRHWDLEKARFLQICPKEMLPHLAFPLLDQQTEELRA